MIGAQAPSDYLKQLQTHKAVQLDDTGMDNILLTHCIDPSTRRQDDFEAFTTARKRSLLTRIEVVMGKAIVLHNQAISEGETDEEEG